VSPPTVPVGIDDLHVYGSTLAVDAAAIVAARGRCADEVERLKLVRRSLAPSFEDPVTLAVNAARPILDEAGPVQLLVVATESGLDFAKPLSAYVHHHLGLPGSTFHLEVKHACFGATAALKLASSWVSTHPGQRALVIATDMARNTLGHPAEPVEGAGSVAMLVAAEPRVLILDGHEGFAAREIYDVRRPDPLLEVSNAELSLAAYLDLLEVAWEGFRASAGPGVLHELDHLLFHAPLEGLVRAGHRILVEDEIDDVAGHFDRCVRPSFLHCKELGNIYSGMLYAALAGLADSAPRPGAQVGLYSYGSGSGACFFGGRIGPAAHATVSAHGIADHLRARRTVDVPTYERVVHAHERSLSQPDVTPDLDLVPGLYDAAYAGTGRLVLDRVAGFHRTYRCS
jgi:3-hydroxy-3-methylglutaryl CoA synthase